MPDLIVLDIAMDGLDGLAVCRRLRAKGLGLPVLLLTAETRSRIVSQVSMPARTTTSPSRSRPTSCSRGSARSFAAASPSWRCSRSVDLLLDTVTREARRGGASLSLTARESALLELLMRNARRVVSREQAIAEIWGGAADGERRRPPRLEPAP